MSFSFLDGCPQLKELQHCCYDAEKYALSDPGISVICARKAMEHLVKRVYSSVSNEQTNDLSVYDMLSDRAFIDWLDDAKLMNRLHYIRRIGNEGAHSSTVVSSDVALRVLENLHVVTGEVCIRLNLISYYPPFNSQLECELNEAKLTVHNRLQSDVCLNTINSQQYSAPFSWSLNTTQPNSVQKTKKILPKQSSFKKNLVKKALITTLLLAVICFFLFSGFNESKNMNLSNKSNNTISFGCYEQDNNISNGNEKIEWLLLEEDAESQLLISKYILDCKPYHNSREDITWHTSDLRKWLNEEFLNAAFSSAEKERIVPTSTLSSATDKVFLLRFDQLEAFFPVEEYRNKGMACRTTKYVQETYDEDDKILSWWLMLTGEGHNAAPTPRNPDSGYYWWISMYTTSEQGIRPMIRIRKE